MSARKVFQFKITLDHIEPKVWRRIQIRDDATFWDLHVAIQDSFGWLDCHLHEFRVHSQKGVVRIGLPDPNGFDEKPPIADWKVPLSEYLHIEGQEFSYVYDFGDDWYHSVIFEGQFVAVPRKRYPTLIDGANACPPEDVGGPPGYFQFLEAIHNPSHEQHAEMKQWLGRSFDPRRFQPDLVRFDNAAERLIDAGIARRPRAKGKK